MVRRPLSETDLEKHLQEQIQLLQLSADSFDNGYDAEAKRMAVSIRVLVHETKNSHSLLGQLGKLNQKFFNSALENADGNPMPYSGLIMVKMAIKETGSYIAMLDDGPEDFKLIPFQEWWTSIIFDNHQGVKLSRKDLILTASNQDGGAHVDPKLDESYARLAKDNVMGWTYQKDDRPPEKIEGIEKVAIRQIAHEVLKTLVPNYQKKQEKKGDGIIFGGIQLVTDKNDPRIKREEVVEVVGRNEKCPCKSGRKYKKCHGK